MKKMNRKLVFIPLVASMLISGCLTTTAGVSGTQAKTVTLVSGAWQCQTNFPNGAAQTVEQIEYDATTQNYQSIGQTSFKLKDGKMLPFNQLSAGKWTITDNQLVKQGYGSQGVPADEALHAELQKNTQLQQALAPMMAAVNQGASTVPANWQIDQLTESQLATHLAVGEGLQITTVCEKVSNDKIVAPIANKEIIRFFQK